MDPRQFQRLPRDNRLDGACVYCGCQPGTRDHVPSKILLDESYPSELPVVEACSDCNVGFSLDEQYLACFLECVICGSADPSHVRRPKIRKILQENAKLQSLIAASRTIDAGGNCLWEVEADRARNVIMKLARGHAAYELYPQLGEPTHIEFAPVSHLSYESCIKFGFIDRIENDDVEQEFLFPELGSRSFLRYLGKKPDHFPQVGDWIVVQSGRYRYSVKEDGEITARMVLSEYLAGEVSWE